MGEWTARQHLAFVIRLGLGKGFKRVRGFPRQLTDRDHDLIAEAIVQHLELSNYTIAPGDPVRMATTDLQSKPGKVSRASRFRSLAASLAAIAPAVIGDWMIYQIKPTTRRTALAA